MLYWHALLIWIKRMHFTFTKISIMPANDFSQQKFSVILKLCSHSTGCIIAVVPVQQKTIYVAYVIHIKQQIMCALFVRTRASFAVSVEWMFVCCQQQTRKTLWAACTWVVYVRIQIRSNYCVCIWLGRFFFFAANCNQWVRYMYLWA